MSEVIMHTQMHTCPDRAAARHGFPLPLAGELAIDIRMLLTHAPVKDTTFHVTYEGELFVVTRQVLGDIGPLLSGEVPWSKVAVFTYRPAALDVLIGRQEPVRVVTDGEAPEVSVMLVGPSREHVLTPESSHLVTVIDTYRRI